MLVTLVSGVFIPAIKENRLFCERDFVEYNNNLLYCISYMRMGRRGILSAVHACLPSPTWRFLFIFVNIFYFAYAKLLFLCHLHVQSSDVSCIAAFAEMFVKIVCLGFDSFPWLRSRIMQMFTTHIPWWAQWYYLGSHRGGVWPV